MAKKKDADIFDFKSITAEMTKLSEEMAEAYAQGISDNEDEIHKKQESAAKEILKLKQQGFIKNKKEEKAFVAAMNDEERAAKIKTQTEVENRAAKAQANLLKEQANSIKAKRDSELEVLTSQQEFLKAASASSKKEHDWQVQHTKNQNKYLEAQNEAEKLKAKLEEENLASNKAILAEKIKLLEKEAEEGKRKALQEEKQHQREQKKEAAADELQSYSAGDIFKDAFLEANLEKENLQAAKEKIADENMMKTLKGVGKAITDGLNAINNSIKSYASHQTTINSRLQGISSYSKAVDKLEEVAYSPLLKAEDLYSNLAELVGEGIATNVEQRAFFATTKDGIAQTFDVSNESLRRIIRLQREDSTAARLGLEAYLNKFLNTYVESTEYLTSTFDNVASSLFEASAMLGKVAGAGASAEFEYVVQKWLGTLVGLGFSESTAQNIATAFGQLGSGDVSGLSGSNMQNLLVMAANKMNKSYADMLLEGLNASDANDLMKGIVLYLQELSTYSTNIVKNQLSSIFGVTVSDLIAVTSLEKDLAKIHSNMLSVTDMYDELRDQYNDLPGRVGIANILDNIFANLNYQTGQSIGSSPGLFATWKITDLIQSVTSGINIPHITAIGSGIGFEATVENLIKLGIVGFSTLGNIGKIVSGLDSAGYGSLLLDNLKVKSGIGKVKTFGNTLSASRSSGKQLTEGAYVGNTDSDVYAESALNEASDDAEKDLEERKKKEGNPMEKTEDILLDIFEEVSTISTLALLANKDADSLVYTPDLFGNGKLGFTIGGSLFNNALKYNIDLNVDSISKLFERSNLGLKVDELVINETQEQDQSSSENGSNGNNNASSSNVGSNDSNNLNQSDSSVFTSILDEMSTTNQLITSNFKTLFEKLDNSSNSMQSSNEHITIINNQYDFITSELTTIKGSTDRLEAVSNINNEILTEIKESTIGSFDTITPGITSSENSTYLASMEFSSSFNNLVADVARIAKKYVEGSISDSTSSYPNNLGNSGSGSLTGFTQYEF